MSNTLGWPADETRMSPWSQIQVPVLIGAEDIR
jgi:hypothetical protein